MDTDPTQEARTAQRRWPQYVLLSFCAANVVVITVGDQFVKPAPPSIEFLRVMSVLVGLSVILDLRTPKAWHRTAHNVLRWLSLATALLAVAFAVYGLYSRWS